MSCNIDHYEEQYYNDILLKIVSKYGIDINGKRSTEYDLMKEIIDRKSRNKNIPENNVNSNVDIANIIENDNIYSSTVDNNYDGNDHNLNHNCCPCSII